MDKKYWEFNRKDDLTILVEDEELYVHRFILASCSPVFNVMLESDDFVETSKNVIPLLNKKKENIQEMLNYIYPFGNKISDQTNIDSLLVLSREYRINKIKNLCEEYLLQKTPTVDLLITAQEFDLERLIEKCIEYFSEKALEPLQNHPKYNELSKENKLKLAKGQNMVLRKFFENAKTKFHNKTISYNGYIYTSIEIESKKMRINKEDED
ncbi:speckle-type POZ protein-like A [Hydra vulgaris]|uniref:speckle-type POZ protein-like A n=1 Tax=Hydra vulgaris TaxID=6087 RepID=UPI00064153B8|nr:speckle-type POZ protein-like A [Hydra vulgaris]